MSWAQNDRAHACNSGFGGDRLGRRWLPWIPAGCAHGWRERFAVRCLRLYMVLHLRRDQGLLVWDLIEAVRSATSLGRLACELRLQGRLRAIVRSRRKGRERTAPSSSTFCRGGRGFGQAIDGSADFYFVLWCAVLALLFLLHLPSASNSTKEQSGNREEARQADGS
jgi:hypothetical protein